jgi:hypothetical protein
MTHSDASFNISESVQPHVEENENLRHDTSYVIDDDADDPLVQAAIDSGGEVTNAALLRHRWNTLSVKARRFPLRGNGKRSLYITSNEED